MGGERGSTSRLRLQGKICCACKVGLPPPYVAGERYCSRCKPVQKVVYAAFERKDGWHVVFYDSTTQRRLGRELLLRDDEKLYELARKGHALRELADTQSIEAAIRGGRGGLFLKLTPDQYRTLEGRPKGDAK
jgi:hypothetical protein